MVKVKLIDLIIPIILLNLLGIGVFSITVGADLNKLKS